MLPNGFVDIMTTSAILFVVADSCFFTNGVQIYIIEIFWQSIVSLLHWKFEDTKGVFTLAFRGRFQRLLQQGRKKAQNWVCLLQISNSRFAFCDWVSVDFKGPKSEPPFQRFVEKWGDYTIPYSHNTPIWMYVYKKKKTLMSVSFR